jgi:hypothetical protein
MDMSESPADSMADPEFDETKEEAMDQTASPADAMDAAGAGASLSLVEAHEDTDEMDAGQQHNPKDEESLANEMNAPIKTNEVDLMQSASLAQGPSTDDDMNDAASAAGASEEGMAADDSLAALEDLEADEAERHPDDLDEDSTGAHAQHADRPQADKDGHEEPKDDGDDDAANDEPIPDEEEATPPASLTQVQGDKETVKLVNPTYSSPYDARRFPAGNCLIPGNKKSSITRNGKGRWFSVQLDGGNHMVTEIKVKTRHDCCGERFSGVQFQVSGQVCGTAPVKTTTNTFYTIKCPKPLMGKEVKLIMMKNNYLSLSGLEVFGTPLKEEDPKGEVELGDAKFLKPYDAKRFPIDNALTGKGKKSSIGQRGVGMWWSAQFVKGDHEVKAVSVRTRHDCCGDRFAGVKVFISG